MTWYLLNPFAAPSSQLYFPRLFSTKSWTDGKYGQTSLFAPSCFDSALVFIRKHLKKKGENKVHDHYLGISIKRAKLYNGA
jgi:hypothetical protein